MVLISLKRRPDRLERTLQTLAEAKWPFKQPQIFEAVDGSLVPPPTGWKSGGGAWGCLRSHQRILEQALCDGVGSLLILEDDVCFVDGFVEKVRSFLVQVPSNWDQLMLGGQHVNVLGPPALEKPGVYRCTDCERTHCYAVRGKFMARLYQRWSRGGTFDGTVHCDWIMGRDPEMQKAHKVYAPVEFLVGQEEDKSDISGGFSPRKFWKPPSADLPVIHLEAPKEVAVALRTHGFHIGFTRDFDTEVDVGLQEACAKGPPGTSERLKGISDWLETIQWEVASNNRLICTAWHPQIQLDEIRAASRWPVYPIEAASVDEALLQLPAELRRMQVVPLAQRVIVYFRGPSDVMEAMRRHGWHNGYWRDENGIDMGLKAIADQEPDDKQRTAGLQRLARLLQREAEVLRDGVAVIWHGGISLEEVRSITTTPVVGLAANNLLDARRSWEQTRSVFASVSDSRLS